MAEIRYPNEVFRFANVRAPQKHIEADYPARYVDYSFVTSAVLSAFTLLYETLVTHRSGTNSRTVMYNDCVSYKSNSNYIISIDALYSATWFSNFRSIDDYLRVKQTAADKTELIAVIETALGQTISSYVSASGFLGKKVNLWDNLFAQIILAENSPLRTEIIRVIRLLQIIERLNATDTVLNTGEGIYQGYMATVLLPKTIFPLADIFNEESADPVTPDPANTELDQAVARLVDVKEIYNDFKNAYAKQNYNYKAIKSVPEADADSRSPIDHNEFIFSLGSWDSLSDKTKEYINQRGIPPEFIHVPIVLNDLEKEMREVNKIISKNTPSQYVLRVGTGIVVVNDACAVASTTSPCNPFTGAAIPKGSGNIKPIGMADLKVVQSQLLKYELGEVAHIENILAGETKKRTFRNFNRSEQTLLEESESSSETEKETQTTERFELHTEAAKVLQEDYQSSSEDQKQSSIGLSVTASYGPVSASFNANMDKSSVDSEASSTSQVESNRNSTDYAKNVMSRALSRVIQRTRTQKTVTTIVESEDTTEHGYDNTAPEGGTANNIAGVYRWLDKYYINKVVNYGKRLMFEFVIPEPASFYIFSRLSKATENAMTDAMEVPPPFDIATFNDIDESNYDDYAVKYGAGEVKPPPASSVTVSISKNIDTPTSNTWFTWADKVAVPPGYQAQFARVNVLMSTVGASVPLKPYVQMYLSDQWFQIINNCGSQVQFVNSNPDPSSTTGEIPVIARIYSGDYSISVEVYCVPTDAAIVKWKIDTFNTLQAAYKQRKREYDQWVASQGVVIEGNNPNINRIIEHTELKKHSIEMISGQRFEAFDALKPKIPPYDYPEFSFTAAKEQGKYISFFEQAFEWDQMTYMYYPYFWARKREWINILKRDDNDPLFMAFLQAGAARVLVPVRPAFTKAILYYLSSGGEIWNGEDVPAPTSPLYVSIIDEMKEFDGQFTGGNQEGEPWISKVPTSLVYLTKDGELPDFSGAVTP